MGPLSEARAIYESLSKPEDPHLEAAACDVKLGQAAAMGGHEEAAATYFRRALNLMELQLAGPNTDLDALYATADAYSGLGDLSLRRAQPVGMTAERRRTELVEARSWYERSLGTWQRIPHPNHFTPNGFQAGDPAMVTRNLRRAQAALSSLL